MVGHWNDETAIVVSFLNDSLVLFSLFLFVV